MLLAYVDESYDQRWPVYWIAALICPADTVRSLSAALDDVVLRASRAYPGIAERAELHGHALLHGKDDWQPLADMIRARIGVYHHAFRAIAASESDVVIRGVHVERLREHCPSAHPHAAALEHVLERIDAYAAQRREPVLVIADEVVDARRYRDDLWRRQHELATSRRLTNIVDTIHFAPSNASRLIQAADLIVYLNGRMTSGVNRDERARRTNEALWSRIAVRIHHVGRWPP